MSEGEEKSRNAARGKQRERRTNELSATRSHVTYLVKVPRLDRLIRKRHGNIVLLRRLHNNGMAGLNLRATWGANSAEDPNISPQFLPVQVANAG
jgi:hypothetical protein